MGKYYCETSPTIKVPVLGSNYNIYLDVSPEDDPILKHCDGYTDKTVRRIAVADMEPSCDLDDWNEYRKKVMRHELIHAFMYESGISNCVKWENEGEEHPEAMVDWIAMQFDKLLRAFKMAGAL